MHPPSFCLANWKNLKDKASTIDSIEDVVIPWKITKPVYLFVLKLNVFALQSPIVVKETKAMHKKPKIAPDTALLGTGAINDLAGVILYPYERFHWIQRGNNTVRDLKLEPGDFLMHGKPLIYDLTFVFALYKENMADIDGCILSGIL